MGFEGNIEVNVLDNRKSFRVGSLWTGSYCERVNTVPGAWRPPSHGPATHSVVTF